MARTQRTKKIKATTMSAANDPTPERMAHDPSVLVKASFGHGARMTDKVRQFRTTRVDHLYHLGALTFAQWNAADWWRTQVEVGAGLPRLCADYGQSTGGGAQRDPSPLPLSDRAETARRKLHAAKAALSIAHRMAIEDALDDPHPALVGRAATARCDGWRSGLQALAVYLRVA